MGFIAAAAKFAFGFITGKTIAGALARAVLLNVVASKLFGRETPVNTGLSSFQVTTRSAIQFRPVLYGEAMVSGPVAYQNTANTSGQDIWTVIPLVDHACEDLVALQFDDEQIPVADIDWAPGTGGADGTGTGAVSTARWVGESSTTAVFAFYYLGDPDQPVCGPLSTAFADIDSNFRLRNITYLVLQFRYIPATAEVWKKGYPQKIAAILKGRKIYDSRLDSTNGGSGAHRYTDASTWEYDDNPSMCLQDYLTQSLGADPAAAIDWPAAAAAADDCDPVVAIPAPDNTETRFTCNGLVSLGSTHKDNLDAILSSFDGRLSYAGGVWKTRASVWEAASVSIDADDLAGDVSLRGSAPKAQRNNIIKGVFVDPARSYQAAEFHHVTASEFVTRDDGNELPFDLQLPMTNSNYMAQRIAYRLLEQGDNQQLLSVTLNARGAKIAIGDVIDVTLDELGYAADTFRVISWRPNENGTFDISAREDAADAYTDPLAGEYTTVSGNTVTLPTVIVAPPSTLTAASILEGVKLSWTNPAARLYKHIEIWASDDNDRDNAEIIDTTETADYLDVVSGISRTRYYWVRAISHDGESSAFEPDSDTTTADAYPGKPELPIVADPFVRLGAAYWDVSATGASYVAGVGTDGTDVIALVSNLSQAPSAYLAARRGPRQWDVQASSSMRIFVRWRDRMTAAGGTWSGLGVEPKVRVEDEDESSGVEFTVIQAEGFVYDDSSPLNVWHEHSATIIVTDTGTPPRFIQIGLRTTVSPGFTMQVDFLDAHIAPKPAPKTKSISIENPGAAEDASMFYTDEAITVRELRAVLRGSATPSVTWTVRHATTRNATGAEVVTGGTTTTSVSSGDTVTSFNDATIPAGSFVWVETTAQSGTVNELQVALTYWVD